MLINIRHEGPKLKSTIKIWVGAHEKWNERHQNLIRRLASASQPPSRRPIRKVAGTHQVAVAPAPSARIPEIMQSATWLTAGFFVFQSSSAASEDRGTRRRRQNCEWSGRECEPWAESSDPERAHTTLLHRRRHGARIGTDASITTADAVPLGLRLLRLGRHRQHVLAVLQKGAQEEAAAAAGRATGCVRLAAAVAHLLHPHVQFLEHGDGATHHPCHPQLPQRTPPLERRKFLFVHPFNPPPSLPPSSSDFLYFFFYKNLTGWFYRFFLLKLLKNQLNYGFFQLQSLLLNLNQL